MNVIIIIMIHEFNRDASLEQNLRAAVIAEDSSLHDNEDCYSRRYGRYSSLIHI